MKRIKTNFLHGYNLLLALFLTFLGCSNNDEPIAEYGTPHATFIVTGTIQSETDDEAIPGIKVEMNGSSAHSDESGNYEIEVSDFPTDQTFSMKFTDEDGAENGTYMPLDTIAEFVDPQFTGETDSWDEGQTEKEINIKMTSGNESE